VVPALAVAFVLSALTGLSACSTRDPFGNPFEDPKPGWATVPTDPFAPRGLPMFDGTRGTVLTWFDVSQAIAWADVIVIGEQHDDAVAHSVQRAVVEETMARFPRTAVALEMLERNEQADVDAYLRGEIDVDVFMERTGSRHWAGKDTWVVWYQPVIDAAKERGERVIAANAPRQFVRQARLEGYDALRALPAEQRALFALPRRTQKPATFARFCEVMGAGHGDDPPPEEGLLAGFRSQSVWDATMADSIVRARDSGISQPGGAPSARKVIHLVGQFHSDFEGGLIEELSARDGGLRILVISVQRRESRTLDEADRGRAAIVMYSGGVTAPSPAPRPEPEWAQPAPEGSSDGTPTPQMPATIGLPPMPELPALPRAPGPGETPPAPMEPAPAPSEPSPAQGEPAPAPTTA